MREEMDAAMLLEGFTQRSARLSGARIRNEPCTVPVRGTYSATIRSCECASPVRSRILLAGSYGRWNSTAKLNS
jgi:hypothetical protein